MHYHCRDFPAWSRLPGANARDFLENLGHLDFSGRWVQELAKRRPTLCMSGGIEAYLEERDNNPLLQRGGYRNQIETPPGYVTIQEAAAALNRSRTGLYYLIDKGELETTKYEGRRYVVVDVPGLSLRHWEGGVEFLR